MTNVYAYNELTKRTALVPAHHVSHPILGASLREVRSSKRRGRLSEIVADEKPKKATERSETRLTNTAAPDKDKDNQ